jgi:hypothetical protein
MKEIFNYKFWLEIGDKTLYELLVDIGLVSDSNYRSPQKKLKNDNNLNDFNFSYSFLFFYQKWTFKRNMYLLYLDSLFVFFTSLKYLTTNNFLYSNNKGFLRRSQTSNSFIYNMNNKQNHTSYINLFNYG